MVAGGEVEILTDEADFQVLLLWEHLGTRGTHRHLAQASLEHITARPTEAEVNITEDLPPCL